MTIEHKLHRVEDPADPNRCQAVVAYGQCPYRVVEHSKYCQMHGGHRANNAMVEKHKRLYNLAKWQDRVGDHADSEKVKSLREDIGIMRVMLEEIIGTCKDSNDLILYSGKIADLVSRIEKLVTSCHRLEASTGMLLDKQSALYIASTIVTIISKHIEDGDKIEVISQEIIATILNVKPEEKK